jgi:hypothetical protein
LQSPDDRLFNYRKGEEGLSLFDPDLVEPPLTDVEILEAFRSGSILVVRSAAEVEAKGLEIVPIGGAETLPPRLREAHVEIRPGPGMTRGEFKQALKELE